MASVMMLFLATRFLILNLTGSLSQLLVLAQNQNPFRARSVISSSKSAWSRPGWGSKCSWRLVLQEMSRWKRPSTALHCSGAQRRFALPRRQVFPQFALLLQETIKQGS